MIRSEFGQGDFGTSHRVKLMDAASHPELGVKQTPRASAIAFADFQSHFSSCILLHASDYVPFCEQQGITAAGLTV